MKSYVVFAPPEVRGVYSSWKECREIIHGRANVSYCSTKTRQEASDALAAGSLGQWRRKEASRWRGDATVKVPCLAVDAACSGYPGPVEYRGVVLPDGYEAFRCGPYASGTNNIGEFLAVVAGLKWLESTSLSFPLYSDSETAIKWVKKLGYCNTQLGNFFVPPSFPIPIDVRKSKKSMEFDRARVGHGNDGSA